MPEGTRILVTKTTRAAPDGLTVYRYLAGEIYDLDSDPPMPADLAAVFLCEGWGERCGEEELVQKTAQVPPVEPEPDAPPRVHVQEAPVEPAPDDAACLWCGTPYTARKGHGGPAQRFCSDACRAGFHRGARRWAARELEAGRLDIADLRNA